MPYFARRPRPPLDSAVESLWYCRNEPGPHSLERVLPSGAAQVIVNLKEDETRIYSTEPALRCTRSPGSILSGVQSRYCLIDSAEVECVAGIAFRPGGLASFFRVPSHETRDAAVPLEALWGRRATAELRERLLADADPGMRLNILEHVLAALWNPSGLDRTVAFALHAFHVQPDCASVGAISGQVGLSHKRFIERFKRSVGVTPKHYCRNLRFQHTLARAENGDRLDWTRIALDCGYFDQSHFIHDFRAFAGISPTEYRDGRTEFRNHVKFLQSAAALP